MSWQRFNKISVSNLQGLRLTSEVTMQSSSRHSFESSQTPTCLRLLAVLSLMLSACGSSGTTKLDGGTDAPMDVEGPLTFERDWTRYPAIFTATGIDEIDALGDVHGDPAAMIRTLVTAGLVSPTDPRQWIGGKRFLVVTGDVIDKGTASLVVIDILMALEPQAQAAGGNVVVTLGNHEAEFIGDPSSSKVVEFRTELATNGLVASDIALGKTAYGQWLLNRPVAASIDGWFFSHSGNTGTLGTADITQKYKALFAITGVGGRAKLGDSFLAADDSILEARGWWAGGTSSIDVIDARLAKLSAKHIVFGHDPGVVAFPDDAAGERERGEIASRYGGRLFLIDSGMSSAIGYSVGGLLRITRAPTETAVSLYSDGTTQSLYP